MRSFLTWATTSWRSARCTAAAWGCRLLETERLVLRKPRLDDADDLLEFVGDPDVMRWLGGEAGDLTTAVATIERWFKHWAENDIGHFSVEHQGHVIGRVGFLVWDASNWNVSSYAGAVEPVTEFGWAIARRYWGHGYATEAARALRTWAYDQAGIEHLISLIDATNHRSIRVAEKLAATPGETVSVHGSPLVVWQHPR
jgi:RimJ/RimL family protein N-acetyltransferase